MCADEWYQPADTAELRPCMSYISSSASANKDTNEGNLILQEDGNCSSQWNFFETSVADHLVYLTEHIGTESCSLYTPHAANFTNHNNSTFATKAAHAMLIKYLSVTHRLKQTNKDKQQGGVSSPVHQSITLAVWDWVGYNCLLMIPVFILYLCCRSRGDQSLRSAHTYMSIGSTECAKRVEHSELMSDTDERHQWQAPGVHIDSILMDATYH